MGLDLSKDNPAPASYVNVTVMGGDNVALDYEPGLTVDAYLGRANVTVARGQIVTVNGATANRHDFVEPNSVIVVVGKVANG